MTTKINLRRIPYFRDNPIVVQRLTAHFQIHHDFMVHQLAIATGCKLEEALSICFLLYHHNQAEIYILYSRDDLAINPFWKSKLSEGYPSLPLYSVDNDVEIESLDGVKYDFWLVLNQTNNFLFEI